MRSLVVFLLIGAGVYVAVCALFYLKQDRLLFIGARPVAPLADPRVQAIENVVGGLRLRGVRVRAEEERVVLVYFGGNAEPVAANAGAMLALREVTAYLIDYRGYGDSEGTPSEGALRGDALAHFDWIRKQHPKRRIAIMGRSLGTAMALHVAARRELDGLILISPFASLRDVARFHYPWLPVRSLMRHPFETRGDAQRVGVDALILVAESDSVIPRSATEALVRELPRGPEIHVFPGRDHNDVMANAAEWALVENYLESP